MDDLSQHPCAISHDNIHSLCAKYPEIFCVLTRSCNQNVVVYQINVDKRGNVCQKNPVIVYWLDLDTSLRTKRRRQGILHDYENLSFIEQKYAYGITAKFLSKHKLKVCFSIPNMSCTVLIKGRTATAYHKQKKLVKAHCEIKSSTIQWSLKKMIRSVQLYFADGSQKSIFKA